MKRRNTGTKATESPVVKKKSSAPAPEKDEGTVWRFNAVGVPQCPVPCREIQFEEIWTFISDNVTAKTSRCMYVSGVPGTGKSLIVRSAMDCFSRYTTEKKKHLQFIDVYINGLSLTKPDKIWRKIASQVLSDTSTKKLTPAQALKKLHAFFQQRPGDRLPVVLVVDELDQLLADKKQQIIYTLLDWATVPSNMFSFIAIFNTMSLPETALNNRNASRIGYLRTIFPPYTHDQLYTIVKKSLIEGQPKKAGGIDDDTITLVAKKVAAVSGDARRALEIARRTIEIAEASKEGSAKSVQAAFKEIFMSVRIEMMKHCSTLEKHVINYLKLQLEGSGDAETTLMTIYDTLNTNATFEGRPWTRNQFLYAVEKLHKMKILIVETNSTSMHRRVSLNVTSEDVNFALPLNNRMETD